MKLYKLTQEGINTAGPGSGNLIFKLCYQRFDNYIDINYYYMCPINVEEFTLRMKYKTLKRHSDTLVNSNEHFITKEGEIDILFEEITKPVSRFELIEL